MSAPFIPAATAEKLTCSHPKGTRHQAKIDIALPLIGNGIPPIAVEQTLREKFPEASDSEIQGVVRWCVGKNPTPSGYGTQAARPTYASKPAAKEPPSRSPAEHCKWWMGGAVLTIEQVIESSPIAFRGTPAEEVALLFEQLYQPDEKLNIVCKYTLNEGKANPQGSGKTMTRAEWCEYFSKSGVPHSEAGAWQRPNPCGDGSGSNGAITDTDTTAHRFLLLESDAVSIETQLALFARLKLPIAAIILSGGKSAHAWLRVDAPDADSYRDTAKQVLELLAPFGIDQANKNSSRLSRLPSAVRKIGAVGDGAQRLLFLDSAATGLDIAALKVRLSLPLAEEKPMRALMMDSVDRYQELYNNRGKLGVQVGFDEFDKDTGGFKPGQMTVIAAGTNQGKSSVAVNIVNGAIKRNHGVALFTLEMDREEIADLLVANNCSVNRNCFNTGYFYDEDFSKITKHVADLAKLPLWIFDDASITVEDIRNRVIALNADGRLGMVVIDYIQIVSPSNPLLPREQQVAEMARAIRILAKQTKLPFIILSQLNDEGKLRESRVVAHEAHNVILLEPNEEQTRMAFKVIKGRRIMKKDYELIYEPQYARVYQRLIDDADMPSER